MNITNKIASIYYNSKPILNNTMLLASIHFKRHFIWLHSFVTMVICWTFWHLYVLNDIVLDSVVLWITRILMRSPHSNIQNVQNHRPKTTKNTEITNDRKMKFQKMFKSIFEILFSDHYCFSIFGNFGHKIALRGAPQRSTLSFSLSKWQKAQELDTAKVWAERGKSMTSVSYIWALILHVCIHVCGICKMRRKKLQFFKLVKSETTLEVLNFI